MAEENLAPTGIRSPDVQLVGSLYTDWATQPTILVGAGYFSLSSNARPTFFSIDTGVSFPRIKAAEEWGWQPTTI